MLERVLATVFYNRTSNGRNSPMLMDAIHPFSGEHVKIYAKFSTGCEAGYSALIAEAIAAMVGADLGLPIPEPFIVEIDSQFVDSISDPHCANICRTSDPLGFASKKLPPGYRVWAKGEQVDKESLEDAAKIMAFDSTINNPDRGPDNPNSLTNGNKIAIFDHDLAFIIEGIIGYKSPWVVGGLNELLSAQRHIFFESVVGKNIPLDGFANAWKTKVTKDRIQEYGNALPPSWVKATNRSHEILSYLEVVGINIDSIVKEAKRVLS